MPLPYLGQEFYEGKPAPAGQYPRDMAMDARVDALEAGGASAGAGSIVDYTQADGFAADVENPTLADFQAQAATAGAGNTIRYTTPSGDVWIADVKNDGGGVTVTNPVKTGDSGGTTPNPSIIVDYTQADGMATDVEAPTRANFQTVAAAAGLGNTMRYTSPGGLVWLSEVVSDGAGGVLATDPILSGQPPVTPTSYQIVDYTQADTLAADVEVPTQAEFQAVAAATGEGNTSRYTSPAGKVWLSEVVSDGAGGVEAKDPVLSGLQDSSDGGTETLIAAVVNPLTPNTAPGWLREYIITATAPLTTVTVNKPTGGTEDVQAVEFPVPAPTATTDRINVIWASTEQIYLNLAGQEGVVMNTNPTGENGLKLRTADGATWLVTK